MYDYLVIGLFRWGSLRATDFSANNIILLNSGVLLSIDEMEIKKRKNILRGKDKKVHKGMTDNLDKLCDKCRQWKKIKKKDIFPIVINSGYDKNMVDYIYENLQILKKDLILQVKQQ